MDKNISIEKSDFIEVLKNRFFLVLWIGQILSQFADKILLFYLVVLITQIFSANSAISGLFIAFTIPAIFVGSITGVFCDRWNKKYILIFSNLVRTGLIIILPFGETNLIYIYIISFFVSVATQFFAPAESTMIPAIVEKKNLMAANSLFITTALISIIFGFALGEPIMSLTEHFKSFHWVIVVMYLVSTFSLCFLPSKMSGIESSSSKEPFFKEFKDGIKYIKNSEIVFSAMLQQLIIFSSFAAMSVLIIGFTRDILFLDERYFGYILATAGLGMVIGAGILGQFGHMVEREKLIKYACFFIGILLILIAYTNNLRVVLLISILWGIAASAIVIPTQTIIQENVTENMRGKVFGVQSVFNNTAMSLPSTLAGILADLLRSVTLVIIITGVMTLLGGVIGKRQKN